MSALARFLERVVADERMRVEGRVPGPGLLDSWDAVNEDGDGLLPHERPTTTTDESR